MALLLSSLFILFRHLAGFCCTKHSLFQNWVFGIGYLAIGMGWVKTQFKIGSTQTKVESGTVRHSLFQNWDVGIGYLAPLSSCSLYVFKNVLLWGGVIVDLLSGYWKRQISAKMLSELICWKKCSTFNMRRHMFSKGESLLLHVK